MDLGAPQDEGRRLGKYRLLKELASGGMATVHLARPDMLWRGYEKHVAIKVVHPHLAKNPAFVRMFLDEARIALRIEHPNVCSVIDVGVEAGEHYLVMEYLAGRTLAQVLKPRIEARMDPKEAHAYFVRIIADAAEGLHAAHLAQGPDGESLEIVHRDVSPQNLMITRQGAVKVVDFGVARARERLEHTEVGQVKGKVEYVSPEQIAGTVDARWNATPRDASSRHVNSPSRSAATSRTRRRASKRPS